eukprot:TRINITY_DN25476_c0_g1_i1.p1 TRINITY_DN25476_c0_g1~~TRINITY_DN25476_c0_g1_i1.p1  ORF type:complete len:135 (+),score=5.82 TRINITY_DN25476_c0_g1_i1:20-424(+)
MSPTSVPLPPIVRAYTSYIVATDPSDGARVRIPIDHVQDTVGARRYLRALQTPSLYFSELCTSTEPCPRGKACPAIHVTFEGRKSLSRPAEPNVLPTASPLQINDQQQPILRSAYPNVFIRHRSSAAALQSVGE